MIPSSPKITIEEQQKVVQTILQFVLWNENIQVVEINKNNIDLLNNFIPNIESNHFRYFNKRTSDCIKDHIVTFLFYDFVQNVYFGYTHIDYYDKYWFGIYLNEHYRVKKLGNLLLNYTINSVSLKHVNICEIQLSVDINNIHAIKLYEKNNFVINCNYNDEKVLYMKKIL